MQIIERNPQVRAVVNVPDMVLLREGHLVAVNCANSATEPAIAECIGVNDNDVEVEWLRGSYTTAWVQWCIKIEDLQFEETQSLKIALFCQGQSSDCKDCSKA